MRHVHRSLLLAAPALLGTAATARAGTLTIEISNVRNARGTVHVDVCPQDKFLKDGCVHASSAAAHVGTTVITVADIPDGTYAIQAFHDENRNGEVDRNFLGIPKEGVGFSNDAPIHFGPPSWKDAAFRFSGSMTVRLRMRYMLGASGPAGG
jgi:uncharacterized protein (DUF2141 family)